MADPELEAMSKVLEALDALEPETRKRVLNWAAERYDIAVSAESRTSGPNAPGRADEDHSDGVAIEGEGADGRSVGSFTHFADLFDVINPSSDVDRALVGAYWFQVVQGAGSFQSQQVNNALKDVGHGVDNIARALTNLQERSPALVRQLSKAGRTKQARKTYKLTSAGINTIRERLPRIST